MILAILMLAAAPARVVAADGHWAALQREGGCEAASATLAPAREGRPQARIALHFDAAGGARDGQLALLLSRPPRAGSSVTLTVGETPFLLVARGAMAWSRGPAQERAILAALRASPSARVEARGEGGGRIVDRYALDGAPTAIDAAAACAAALAKR